MRNIPEELKKHDRWVGFRLVPDKDDGKPKKMPVNPKTGHNAKSNAPETWGTYEAAVETAEKLQLSGIGFMFALEDGFVGVDVDHCYDPATDTFSDIAKAIMAKQPTYMEFSPSGDGIHLWFKGKKPKGASKNSDTGVEMYDSGRYFTVTGKQIPGSLGYIAEDNGALAWIHENYLKKPKKESKKKKKARASKLTDEEVLEMAQTTGNSELFNDLWQGKWQDHYPSQSEADMALAMKLAFWTGKDSEQMDRLFRQSALMREKWDVKHHADGATYGEETIGRACEVTDDVYTPAGDSPIIEYEGRYFRIKGDSMYPITNFLFNPVEMLYGDGETQLTADVTNLRDETYRLKMMTTDFGNAQKFKNVVNRETLALGYLGSDGDLEYLKIHIAGMEYMKKQGVKAAGIYMHEGRMVFVTKDGAVTAGGENVDSIVQLDKYVSIRTDILKTDPLTKEMLRDLGHTLLEYNEPDKVIAILSWCAGCFLKPHLDMSGIKFPHLFLIGEAGSGKSTTLEKVILPVFSEDHVIAATQVTPFTLMKDSASSNLMPMAIDEFKPSKIDRFKLNALYNHFRDSYDGHEGVRGRADQSITRYQLLAPLVVVGEESADEAAIRERSIELLFTKKDLKNQEYRAVFRKIEKCRTQLQDFGRALLTASLTVTPEQAAKWRNEGLTLFAKELPSRVINNLSCCYAGLKLLEKLCRGYQMDWDDVFTYKFEPCVKYLEHGAKEYLLDGGTNNQSILEQTFEIMARMNLSPDEDYILDENKELLYLRLAQVYDKYTKYRRDCAIVGEVLTYTQFKKQLLHSDVFVQQGAQKRFNGKNAKCWAVNYRMLLERCDVSEFDTECIEAL